MLTTVLSVALSNTKMKFWGKFGSTVQGVLYPLPKHYTALCGTLNQNSQHRQASFAVRFLWQLHCWEGHDLPNINVVLQRTLPSEITRSQDGVVNILATGWKNWSLNSNRGKRFVSSQWPGLTIGPTQFLIVWYWGVLSECSTHTSIFCPFMMKSSHVMTKGCGSARIVTL